MSHTEEKSSLPVSEVVQLNELIEYQEGSVVSRTLLDKGTGTLTLFAFDAWARVE